MDYLRQNVFLKKTGLARLPVTFFARCALWTLLVFATFVFVVLPAIAAWWIALSPTYRDMTRPSVAGNISVTLPDNLGGGVYALMSTSLVLDFDRPGFFAVSLHLSHTVSRRLANGVYLSDTNVDTVVLCRPWDLHKLRLHGLVPQIGYASDLTDP